MILELLTFIQLAANTKDGGFDHADVDVRLHRLYVAHPGTDKIDVIDTKLDKYIYSLSNFPGVAGIVTSRQKNLVVATNENENTLAVFSSKDEKKITRIPVGKGPDGVALASSDHLALVGNKGISSVSLVDLKKGRSITEIPLPGKPRWAVYDPVLKKFFINIIAPPQISIISPQLFKIVGAINIPSEGPHGLDIDQKRNLLYCATDGKKLYSIDARSGQILHENDISGAPDVIFFNSKLNHLYVAIKDPGVIDVFNTTTMKKVAVVKTEKGAHTLAFDPTQNKVYAFLPDSHRVAVYIDHGEN